MTTIDDSARENPGRILVASMISITVASLPLFLVAALAVLIRGDMAFTDAQLGVVVSVFFATSALGSIPGGRLAERFGPHRVMLLATFTSTLCMLTIALFAHSWLQISVVLAVAGLALAAGGPATNLALARSIAMHRQGFAFGLKQSAVPAATLFAGVAVPLLGLTLGWRSAYASAAIVGAILYALVALRRFGPEPLRKTSSKTFAHSRITPGLVVLALSAVLGSAAGNSLTVFYVASAVSRGMPIGHAGLWLASGSLMAIVGRLLWGWLADLRDGDALGFVPYLWAAGAVGFAVLSIARGAVLLALGTSLAFLAGWGWNGLFHFAVSRSHAGAPAAATGVTTTGMFVGGMVGPLAFGFAAHHLSYTVAWLGGTGSLLGAAVLVAIGRRMLARGTVLRVAQNKERTK